MYIFGGRESNPLLQKIIDALKAGPLSTTELHRALSNHATNDNLKSALQELLAAVRIVQTEEKTSRKPRKIYRRVAS
jgi:DNA-binding HxlR family transcriptional regulator